MDEHSYLITDRRTHTSVPGVFAAGEIADPGAKPPWKSRSTWLSWKIGPIQVDNNLDRMHWHYIFSPAISPFEPFGLLPQLM